MTWNEIISATKSGQTEKLQTLLDKSKVKSNLNNINDGQYSIIHLAFLYDKYACAFLLLEAGINPYAGIDGQNLLNTFTAAENLMMIKLLLWYNPDYENVKLHSGKTALERIKGWDCSQPRRGILASINQTKTDVLQYRENTAVIEKQLCIANNPVTPKTNVKEAYLTAIHYLMLNAELILKAYEETKQDEIQRTREPTAYQAITQHYLAKVVFCLKQAIIYFRNVGISSLTLEQHNNYVNLLDKIICYAPDIEKKYWAVEQANLLISLSQLPAYAMQKESFLDRAKQLYEKEILSTFYSPAEQEQKIFHLKNAAQLYQYLAENNAGETKRINIEKAIVIYYQIADAYQAMDKKSQPLAKSYKQQAQLLEHELNSKTQLHITPLSSCYPLHQRRQVKDNARNEYIKSENSAQPEEPLLSRKAGMS